MGCDERELTLVESDRGYAAESGRMPAKNGNFALAATGCQLRKCALGKYYFYLKYSLRIGGRNYKVELYKLIYKICLQQKKSAMLVTGKDICDVRQW